jgi:hypothetical protein
MKKIELSEFEIYLIKEALTNYNRLINETTFNDHSIISKDFIRSSIVELQAKLDKKKK